MEKTPTPADFQKQIEILQALQNVRTFHLQTLTGKMDRLRGIINRGFKSTNESEQEKVRTDYYNTVKEYYETMTAVQAGHEQLQATITTATAQQERMNDIYKEFCFNRLLFQAKVKHTLIVNRENLPSELYQLIAELWEEHCNITPRPEPEFITNYLQLSAAITNADNYLENSPKTETKP